MVVAMAGDEKIGSTTHHDGAGHYELQLMQPMDDRRHGHLHGR